MTQPHQMSPLERLEELETRFATVEAALERNQEIVAHAVLNMLKEEVLLEEVIKRVVAAVEAEWTGKFLPELRQTVRADVMESLRTGSL